MVLIEIHCSSSVGDGDKQIGRDSLTRSEREKERESRGKESERYLLMEEYHLLWAEYSEGDQQD